MWWRDKDFPPKLEAWWAESDIFSGTSSFRFVKRLKMVKQTIREWNEVSFKNIFAEKLRVETEEGDLNTKIFHASVKEKRVNNRITRIQDGVGAWKDKAEVIEGIAVNHFKALLGDSIYDHLPTSLLDIIPKLVSEEENFQLMQPFTLQEIRKATFDNPPFKSPRLDDMMMEFFQKCCGFMGEDILKVAEDFRRKGRFVRELNNTVIVLIPKKQECSTMMDFCPISQCNSLYKIVSKAIMNRLKPLLNKIISSEQHGFIPGREIMDSILSTKETIHSMQITRSPEALGRNIKKQVKLGLWRGISIHDDLEHISHSQFADDTICLGRLRKGRLSNRAYLALDILLKKFLWEGSKETSRIPLINWEMAYMIKEEGGVGLRKMNLQNLALGAKLGWKMFKYPQKLWCRIMDSWNGDVPIDDLFEDKDWVNHVEASVGPWVADYLQIQNLSWKSVGEWHQVNQKRLSDILLLKKVFPSEEEDSLLWSASKSGDYRVNLGYEL
ncbi:uncharacterized protein LOC131860177 [Cryptomeria japonica]|uniref:uncharacterized protein LOC131860177 n=1 Tax=Cryptomeria japonica TaxID=3369 RepID=UPI0027D9F8BD|nr:uncharacterized protein LOC131860177 [Cryptomeria japonica]